MAKLEYISDNKLFSAVSFLLEKSSESIRDIENNPAKLHKNIIDPFSPIFEMVGFNLSRTEWVKNEMKRQAQKTLQNHIGEFHQKILGNIPGWEDLGTGNGCDIVSEDRKIIAEIKNKHNTVSGGKLKDVYCDLQDQVMPKNSKYKGYEAYYVQIIPSKPSRFNKPFTPSDKNTGSKKQENHLIRKIDGYSFYELVTQVDDALYKLQKVIPEVIKEMDSCIHLDIDFLDYLFSSAFSVDKTDSKKTSEFFDIDC